MNTLDSLLAQARRCGGGKDKGECKVRKCKRCARGIAWRRNHIS